MNANTNRAQAGFTMVEILVVVAILGIITTIAIPRFLTVKRSANEAATIGALRTIDNCNEIYRSRTGSYGTVADLVNAELLDTNFASVRQGYRYTDTGTVDRFQYGIAAEPAVPGTSGDRYFFIDESGVIRTSPTPPAGAASSAVD